MDMLNLHGYGGGKYDINSYINPAMICGTEFSQLWTNTLVGTTSPKTIADKLGNVYLIVPGSGDGLYKYSKHTSTATKINNTSNASFGGWCIDSNNNLYVILNNILYKYGIDGILVWQKSGYTGIQEIKIGSDNCLYTAVTSSKIIRKYKEDFATVDWEYTSSASVYHISLDSLNNVYFDNGYYLCKLNSTHSGTVWTVQVGTSGNLVDILIDTNDNINAIYSAYGSIKQYTTSGVLNWSIGLSLSSAVFTLDSGNNINIGAFSSSDQVLTKISSNGKLIFSDYTCSLKFLINDVVSISVDNDGYLYLGYKNGSTYYLTCIEQKCKIIG